MKPFHKSQKAHIILPIIVSAFKYFIIKKDKAVQNTKNTFHPLTHLQLFMISYYNIPNIHI